MVTMKKESKLQHCDCPIDTVADIIGSKWVIILLRDLFIGKKRFNEFLKGNPHLSNKVLNQKLKELEEKGIIHKSLNNESKIEYTLTEKGQKIKPVMKALVEYGKEYCNSKEMYKELIKKL